jgi:protein-tyrosine phosphatase
MHAPAARQVRARGGDPAEFRARVLTERHVRDSDLVLTATIEQAELVADLGSRERVFVIGEFARLADGVDLAALPPFAPTVAAVAARGRALVAAAGSSRGRARPDDELGDPWGRGEKYFADTADAVERHLAPLVRGLVGATPDRST